jgi:hypothetical protein
MEKGSSRARAILLTIQSENESMGLHNPKTMAISLSLGGRLQSQQRGAFQHQSSIRANLDENNYTLHHNLLEVRPQFSPSRN